jgi:periplasmic divalent cation tolerance protein
MLEDYCIVMTTCPEGAVSKTLVEGLLKNRLAACIQEIGIASSYRWKGKLEHENEILLLIKTKSALYDEIEAFINANHPYEVPEIIRVPVTAGSPSYLAWIDEECSPRPAEGS